MCIRDSYMNNIARPLVLLGAMQAAGVTRFVFSSTCATYGVPTQIPIPETEKQDPINPYGSSKYMLDKVCRDCDSAWGLKSVFLRYFNASGCSEDGLIGEDHEPETHLIPNIPVSYTHLPSHEKNFFPRRLPAFSRGRLETI